MTMLATEIPLAPAPTATLTPPHPAKAAILIVDDHPTMREGLAGVIDREPDLAVCGQAETAAQALALMETTQPTLAIVDISLAGQNGIELIKDLRIRYPQLPVLVHSMHDESVYAERSLRAGAKGYITKQEPPARLLQAIRQVIRGDIYLSDHMTRHLLSTITTNQPAPGASPLNELSDREFEVFELISRGLGTKQIAETLHLSQKTVQAHRDHIRSKLNLKDGAGLVRFAIQWAAAQS